MTKLLTAALLAIVAAGSLTAPSMAGSYTQAGDYLDDEGFLVPNDDDMFRKKCRRERVIVYDELGQPQLRRMNDCPERRYIRYKRPVPPITHQKEMPDHGDRGDRGDKETQGIR